MEIFTMKIQKVTAKVTKKLIKRRGYASESSCPISYAVNRLLKPDYVTVVQENTIQIYKPICNMDDIFVTGEIMIPDNKGHEQYFKFHPEGFEFEIELPRKVIRKKYQLPKEKYPVEVHTYKVSPGPMNCTDNNLPSDENAITLRIPVISVPGYPEALDIVMTTENLKQLIEVSTQHLNNLVISEINLDKISNKKNEMKDKLEYLTWIPKLIDSMKYVRLDVGEALLNLSSLERDVEYLKWTITGSHYHSNTITITAPHESQNPWGVVDCKVTFNGNEDIAIAIYVAITATFGGDPSEVENVRKQDKNEFLIV
jgi:hypothetical protein